jgi:diguanylate cyclase (GGDEF)-like protein/PAS domain S-box-containing protein
MITKATEGLARWAWPVLVVTVVLLGALLALTLTQNFDADLALARGRAEEQLQLITQLVSNELQGDHYQDIDPLLERLAQSDPSIADVRLTSVNGFVIAQYHRPRDLAAGISLETAISYSYHRAAVLTLEIDLSALSAAQRRLSLEVGAIYLAFCGLLALLNHIALRRYREAAQLRLADAQLRDTNRTLQVLSNCNQALVRAASQQDLMDELCRILVDEGGYPLAWIGFAEHGEGLPVKIHAAKGRTAYLGRVKISWAGTQNGDGPAGQAIRGGRTQIIRDFETDDAFRPWRDSARAFDLRSCIALPLGSDVPAFGVLLIYSELAARFSSAEIRLLEELASDLSYGIGSLRNEARRREAEDQVEQQGRRFRALVESSADGVVLLRVGGMISYVGPSITRILGYAPAEVEGRSAFDFLHSDDAPAFRAHLERSVAVGGGTATIQARVRDKAGHWRATEGTISNLLGDPDVMGIVVNFRDITERLALEREREESNERFLQIADNVSEAFWVSDTGGLSLIYASAAYERIWQRGIAELAADPQAWLKAVHPDDADRVRKAVADKAIEGSYDEEFRIVRPDGTIRWIRDRAFPVKDAQGRVHRVVGTAEDITDRKSAAMHIQYLAYYDQLTGLANRTLFNDRLRQRLHGAEAGEDPIGVILLDIDRFRFINDSLGRLAGDDLIKQIGERLLQFTGDAGALARTGSNQFAVVLEAAGGAADVAHQVGRLFRACFDAAFQLASEAELRIAVKAGIALSPDDGVDAEVLQRNAEAALQKAKGSGEKFLFYARHMNEKVAEKLSLESKLQAALARDEFVLHYQPKISLKTGAVEGVEALIRWQSPELGLVQPLEFISILEDTGLILDVGAWVIRRAAQDYREWCAAGIAAPRVAVNVSAVQLRRNDFVKTLHEALAHGPGAAGIDIEITESLLMDDMEENVAKLEAARDMGIRIAVDDFGTGYSSLGYLAKLPAHTLKIDRSFVITMLGDPNVMTLVSMIISTAHSIGLDVVAEGVDQERQAQALADLQCDQIQGYLISRPVPKEKLVSWLRERGAARVALPEASGA